MSTYSHNGTRNKYLFFLLCDFHCITSSMFSVSVLCVLTLVSGRSPSSIRIGGGSSVRESVPGTSSQLATSPQTSRTFLGRFGIRKPSLLSLSSATSVSVAATSPHTYENRTFSLDDLLRPSRSSMMSKEHCFLVNVVIMGSWVLGLVWIHCSSLNSRRDSRCKMQNARTPLLPAVPL
jgi:hypothetical protein